MSESYRLERGRGGGQHLIGVQALAELLHVGQDEVYGLKKVKKVHAQMVAADIDEPSENNVGELLENLPWEEREYYQEEKNVITPSCVSESLFAELTERFAFVGVPRRSMQRTSPGSYRSRCGTSVRPTK